MGAVLNIQPRKTVETPPAVTGGLSDIPRLLLSPSQPVIQVATPADPFFPLVGAVNMTNEEYHADRSAVSCSGLKELLRSPMHFQHYLNNPREETKTFRLGTAIHCALLEYDRFVQEYIVKPDFGRSKADKEAEKKFVEDNPGKFFVTQTELDMIRGIADQVDRHNDARELLKLGTSEQSFFWVDEETGIRCKIRVDSLTPYCILDVKSTEDASKQAFSRSCVNYEYDLQAAMYKEGLLHATGQDLDFAFLPVEKKAPHGVAVYVAPEEMLARGYGKFRKALATLKRCRETNIWGSYQEDGQYEVLEWPKWAK